jgi:hypothetical protein
MLGKVGDTRGKSHGHHMTSHTTSTWHFHKLLKCSGGFREYVYFQSWGNPANLWDQEAQKCKKQVTTAHEEHGQSRYYTSVLSDIMLHLVDVNMVLKIILQRYGGRNRKQIHPPYRQFQEKLFRTYLDHVHVTDGRCLYYKSPSNDSVSITGWNSSDKKHRLNGKSCM